MITVNAVSGMWYMILVWEYSLEQRFETFHWVFPALIVCSLLNVMFAVLLLRWHGWAFYAFLLVNVLVVLISGVAGLGVSIPGLLGPVVLYAVLQIEGPNGSTWKQLSA